MATEDQTSSGSKLPRYRLTEKAYIDDRLLEIGTEITHEGVPGWHMEPLNAEAKAMVKKHYPNGQVFQDPILRMAQISV